MIIGIDIDDTITQLKDRKIEIATKYIKEHNLPYKLINEDGVRFSMMYDWPLEVCNKFWLEIAFELLDSATPRPNAVNVIQKLKSLGHKIVIITARSDNALMNAYNMSAQWFARHNIPFDKLIYGFEDKTQVCVDEKVDIFIDDIPTNLIRLEPYGIKTILMGTAHNKVHDGYDGIRVEDWFEIEKHIYNKD